MPKNIIIFSDGTGQDGGKGNNTNIYKLFNMIEDRTDEQIAFYDAGVGTGWHKITGNISGVGLSKNIQQCYRFIFDNYEAGDHIILFGFSRGAATVRSLSSFIHYFGILPKSRPKLIKRAYKIYKKSSGETRKKLADEFVEKHHTMWANVHFLGCYDTVSALGVPNKTLALIIDKVTWFKHNFHNYDLSPSVRHAYQALAIDDERKTFSPKLWSSKTGMVKATDDKANNNKIEQTIRQVWFCGMHTDVGGGYKEQELSDIPLVWMTQQAVEKGLKIYPKHKIKIKEDVNGEMHNSREGIYKLYRQKERYWQKENRTDELIIHQSVFERIKNTENKSEPAYAPWILNENKTKVTPIKEPWVKHELQAWYVKVEDEKH